jgi:hypothetical protein
VRRRVFLRPPPVFEKIIKPFKDGWSWCEYFIINGNVVVTSIVHPGGGVKLRTASNETLLYAGNTSLPLGFSLALAIVRMSPSVLREYSGAVGLDSKVG